jgi:hypothetical protein
MTTTTPEGRCPYCGALMLFWCDVCYDGLIIQADGVDLKTWKTLRIEQIPISQEDRDAESDSD